MAKLAIKKGATDVTVYLFAQDSSKTTGAGLTGLAYNTASLSAYYIRLLNSATAITLATLAASTSAHSDGGFKEVDATNMPGVYRLDLPDAVCATGADSVVVMLKGATNLAPVLLELQLLTKDPNDVATETNLAVVDGNVDSILADTGTDGVVVASGTITTLSNLPAIPADWITAAGVKADAVTKIQNGLATPTNITAGTITTVTTVTNQQDVLTPLAVIDGIVDDILTDTGTTLDTLIKDIPTNAELATALGTADDAVLAALSVIRGADSDTLETLSDQIDGISAGSGLDAAGVRDAIGLASANLDTQLSTIDGNVDDILTDTSTTIPGTLTTVDTVVDGIATTLASPNNFKADVSALTNVTLAATQTGVTIPVVTTVGTATNLTNLPNGTGTNQISLSGGKVLLQAAQTGVTIPTVTTVTNAPADMALDSTVAKDATVAKTTHVQEVEDKVDNLDGDVADVFDDVGDVKTVVDTILADTGTTLDGKLDTLIERLTAARAGYLDKLNVAGVLAHSDAADTYKADVSGLMTAAAYTAPDNAGIGDIKTVTDQFVFTEANRVDASADVVLSDETLEDMAEAIGEGLADEVWSSTIRTLTQSADEIVAAISGTSVSQIRGNSWEIQFTELTLGAKQQVAIKLRAADADSAAILMVDSTDGLLVLNGSTIPAPEEGEDDEREACELVYEGTTLTLTVDAAISAQLPVGAWPYGIQSIEAGIVAEPYGGTFQVLADVVRATK